MVEGTRLLNERGVTSPPRFNQFVGNKLERPKAGPQGGGQDARNNPCFSAKLLPVAQMASEQLVSTQQVGSSNLSGRSMNQPVIKACLVIMQKIM